VSKLTTIVLASLTLVGIGLTTSTGQANSSQPKRTKIDVYTYGANDGGFATNWYRLKHATKVNVTYSAVTNSHAINKTLKLAKGTIIGAQRYHHGAASQKDAYTTGYMTPNISYHLKSRLVNKHVYGFGAVSFKLSPKQVVQIHRPAYALPYGSGTLYTGGLGSIKTLNRNVDAVKLTSDGYIETYNNDPKKYGSFWGTLESHYDTKPTSSAKITHTIKRNNTVYLYYAKHLAGMNDQQVRRSGNYKYRLTLTNMHTPYQYNDDAYGGKKAVASIYHLGGTPYFTVIGTE
jgi:hypothetical protein